MNNQAENPIAKKLDRVLVNDAWMHQFSQSYAKFEASGISDHARSRVFLEAEPLGRKFPFNVGTEFTPSIIINNNGGKPSEPVFS